jgi:hypothetical protein
MGNIHRAEDLVDVPDCDQEELEPLVVRIVNPKKIKVLDRLVDEAEKESLKVKDEGHAEDEQSEDGETEASGEGERKQTRESEGPDDDAAEHDSKKEKTWPVKKTAKHRHAKSEKTRTTLSAKFEDVDTGYSFDFYMARSRKNRNLYFVAVCQGKKPLRYWWLQG